MKAMPDIAADAPAPRLLARSIAAGEGWRISEFLCSAGPEDAPFEERHQEVSISAVVAGSFQYASPAGRALLYPGAFLLGNAGSCFTCGHRHGRGDRCIAFQFAPSFFEEISASVAGTARFRFTVGMLPPVPELMGAAVAAERIAGHDHAAGEELAIGVAERAIALASGVRPGTIPVHPRDEKRISAALRHIEACADDPLDLDTLAGVAAMSKYHFLRSFRRCLGVTPYRYLLGLRLRRAAVKLTTTAKPIAAIAFEAGFGDLSTFNAHFRRSFKVSPSALRREAAGAP
jgi:AraC family transcriptional regulator